MRGEDVCLTFGGRRIEPLREPAFVVGVPRDDVRLAFCDRYGWRSVVAELGSLGNLTLRAVRRCGCEIVVTATRHSLASAGDKTELFDQLVAEAVRCDCDAKDADFERSG